jgi:mono/diheme cytochrome c family protein
VRSVESARRQRFIASHAAIDDKSSFAMKSKTFSMRCSLLAVLVSPVLLAGCGQDMVDQPHYEPLEESAFFEDEMSSRPLVPGTVARGNLRTDRHYYEGRTGDGPATEFPPKLLEDWTSEGRTLAGLLDRGQERFMIYCSPSHGMRGDGDGMVVRRGFPAPPSFVDGETGERLRKEPVGHFYSVITNGIGRMYPYAAQVAPEDRWAITAYIQALQLSQHATEADLGAAWQKARAAARRR